MMKGYVAIPIRLPTGELTGYIGVTEAKLSFPTWSHFQRRVRKKSPATMRGFILTWSLPLAAL